MSLYENYAINNVTATFKIHKHPEKGTPVYSGYINYETIKNVDKDGNPTEWEPNYHHLRGCKTVRDLCPGASATEQAAIASRIKLLKSRFTGDNTIIAHGNICDFINTGNDDQYSAIQKNIPNIWWVAVYDSQLVFLEIHNSVQTFQFYGDEFYRRSHTQTVSKTTDNVREKTSYDVEQRCYQNMGKQQNINPMIDGKRITSKTVEQERDERIINMFTNGDKLAAIHRETKVSRPTINKILEKAGLK